MKMNNRQFYNLPRITVAVYFTYFECIEALAEQVVCLKKLITSAFESSKPLFLLMIMGVSAPSRHRESTDSIAQYGSTVYMGVAMVYPH